MDGLGFIHVNIMCIPIGAEFKVGRLILDSVLHSVQTTHSMLLLRDWRHAPRKSVLLKLNLEVVLMKNEETVVLMASGQLPYTPLNQPVPEQ